MRFCFTLAERILKKEEVFFVTNYTKREEKSWKRLAMNYEQREKGVLFESSACCFRDFYSINVKSYKIKSQNGTK